MRNAIIITLLVSTLLTFSMTMSNSDVTASGKMLRFAQDAGTERTQDHKSPREETSGEHQQPPQGNRPPRGGADQADREETARPERDEQDRQRPDGAERSGEHQQTPHGNKPPRGRADQADREELARDDEQAPEWYKPLMKWGESPAPVAGEHIKMMNCIVKYFVSECRNEDMNCEEKTVNDVLGENYANQDSPLRDPKFCGQERITNQQAPAPAPVGLSQEDTEDDNPQRDYAPKWWGEELMQFGENSMEDARDVIKLMNCVRHYVEGECHHDEELSCNNRSLNDVLGRLYQPTDSVLRDPYFCNGEAPTEGGSPSGYEMRF
jgi:hypothetical protein